MPSVWVSRKDNWSKSAPGAVRYASKPASATASNPAVFFCPCIGENSATPTYIGQTTSPTPWSIPSPKNPILNTVRYKRSEEHTSELQSRENLVCRLLLEKKNK